MASVTSVPSRIAAGDFVDVPVPGSGDNGKAVTYNHGTGLFVYTGFEASGAVSTHVGLANPHSQYLLASSYTAADVFAKVLTLDGSGSGLDADLLDGNSSAAFAAAGHSHTIAHGSTTGLSNDDHTQYLLASGSRNGAATIVASSAGATPLTLKMASGQTADGLRVVDASSNDLIFFGPSGWVRTFDRVIVGNNITNEYGVNYAESTGYVDYGGNVGQVDMIGMIHTVQDLASPFSNTTYYVGNDILLIVDDTNATGQLGYSYAIGGVSHISSTSTRAPYANYGLSFGSENYSSQGTDVYGAYIFTTSGTAAGTNNNVGVYASINNSGSGTVAYGVAVQVDKPFSTGGHYTMLAGVDVADFSGYTNATTAYAIRTQGGQVLHQAGTATTVPLVVQGAASQTANLVQWKNSSGTVLSAITKDGYLAAGQTAATAAVDVVGSSTSRSSMRLRSGTAPTSPNDGDFWYDGSNLKFRLGGTTKTITWT